MSAYRTINVKTVSEDLFENPSFFYLELLVKKQCFWTKVQQTKHVATVLCVHTFFWFQLVLLVLFKLSRIILWNDSLVFVRGAGFILRRVWKHVQTAQNLMQSFQKKNKTKSQERRKKMNEKLKMMRSPLIFQLKKGFYVVSHRASVCVVQFFHFLKYRCAFYFSLAR